MKEKSKRAVDVYQLYMMPQPTLLNYGSFYIINISQISQWDKIWNKGMEGHSTEQQRQHIGWLVEYFGIWVPMFWFS